MNWIVLAFLSAVFMAMYHVFMKLAATNGMHQVLGAVVLQLVALLVGAMAMFLLKVQGQSLPFSKRELLFAILAGISVGLAEILVFYAFGQGGLVSKVVPIVVTGSILLATIISWAWLGEGITAVQILGVCMVITGTILLVG